MDDDNEKVHKEEESLEKLDEENLEKSEENLEKLEENLEKLDEELEKLEEEELVAVKEQLKNIYDIWNVLGVDKRQKNTRAKLIWAHIKSLLKDVYDEETARYIEIQDRIQHHKLKVRHLSNILHLTFDGEIKGTLIQQEGYLRYMITRLSRMKLEREISYRELKRLEAKLCRVLRKPEHKLPAIIGVPTKEELKELKNHVELLKEEEKMRHIEFDSGKEELYKIWETTDFSPETVKEKEIFEGIDKVSVSDKTLDDLEEVVSATKEKKSELQALKRDLVKRLKTWWQRLRVEHSFREEFLAKHGDLKIQTINSILEEIERCEKVKFDEVQYMNYLRKALHDIWDKCYVSESVRRQFAYYSGGEDTAEAMASQNSEDIAANESESTTEDMAANEVEGTTEDMEANEAEGATEDMAANEAEGTTEDMAGNEVEGTTEVMTANEAEATTQVKAAIDYEEMAAYEAEVYKWRSYYKDAQHIIEKIVKLKNVWDELIEFEIKAADPNRYKDRNWNLLREAKMRKKLNRSLTALENSIFKSIEVYEAAKETPFLFYSEDFEPFVFDYHVQGTIQKEERKKPRLQPVTRTPKSSPTKTVNSKPKTSNAA